MVLIMCVVVLVVVFGVIGWFDIVILVVLVCIGVLVIFVSVMLVEWYMLLLNVSFIVIVDMVKLFLCKFIFLKVKCLLVLVFGIWIWMSNLFGFMVVVKGLK